MVIPLPKLVDGVDLLVWGVPSNLVYPWSVFALVFRHSSYGKHFATKRVG
jgi:hypothetical protein